MVLTQQWAKANPVIHFSVMHPGWADTPGTDSLCSSPKGPYCCCWYCLSLFLSFLKKMPFNEPKIAPTHCTCTAALPIKYSDSSPHGGAIAHVFRSNLWTIIKKQPNQHSPDTTVGGETELYRLQFVLFQNCKNFIHISPKLLSTIFRPRQVGIWLFWKFIQMT